MIERDTASEGYPPLQLSDQQQLFYKVLLEQDRPSTGRSRSLSDIYVGAIRVLEDDKNPHRVSQAAYGMRELMDRLEQHLGINRDRSSDVANRVQEIEGSWDTAVRRSRCLRDTTWECEIDESLSRFLNEMNEFFSWYKNRVTGKKASSQVSRKLQHTEAFYPESLHKERQERWSDAYSFFNGILHQHKVVGHVDFGKRLQDTELFFLDLFRPKPTEDFDSIDEVVREGEHDAHQ